MRSQEKPLYRRQNKKALNYRHTYGESHFRHDRNTKKMKQFEGSHMAMIQKNRGFDYTPLYKFLLSKVGCEWDDIYSEVIKRLDSREPIFYMVKLVPGNDDGIVCLGENTYYSSLTVRDGILEKINPKAGLEELYCGCCTHTFNGEVWHLPVRQW